MIVLKNITMIDDGIVAMDIYINGKKSEKYYLVLNMSEDEISVNEDISNVPADCYVYVRHAWQELNEYIKNNKPIPSELTSAWC